MKLEFPASAWCVNYGHSAQLFVSVPVSKVCACVLVGATFPHRLGCTAITSTRGRLGVVRENKLEMPRGFDGEFALRATAALTNFVAEVDGFDVA